MADLALTARLNTSAADTRRGVVRLHPEALAALGLREWDPIALTGGRRTAAVVGIAPAATPAGVALLDDVTLSNCGVKESATVVIAPVTVYGARQVQVSGSVLATQSIPGGIAAAPRPRPGHQHRRGIAGTVAHVRGRVDLGVAHGHRGGSDRPGQRATEHRGRVGVGNRTTAGAA
jgi:hypothetical protein